MPLPSPPLEFHEDRLQFDNEESAQRMCSTEEHIADLEHRVSELVTKETMNAKFKACEDKINYCLQRELDRVKQLFHSKINYLSQSIVDCLKRRDQQLEQQFKTFKSLMSTPMHTSTSTTHKMSQTPSKIDPVTQTSTKQVTYLSSSPNPPVKLELPTFSNLDSEDPIDFIDRFEEPNELRPLYPEELLAVAFRLTDNDAKSCWRVEKLNIRDWVSFFVFK